MLFADDVVLVDESKAGVNRKLELWRCTLESKGFRLSRTKTEYMMCDFSASRHEGGDNGDIDEDVMHRISAGWLKWRQAYGVLCDRRVPQKLKGKFYRIAICLAKLYGAECWPTKRRHVQQLSVAEIQMLWWFCGHTRRDREKLTQHRLRWFGHVQRRPPEAPVHSGVLKRVDKVKRGRGRHKLTWKESVKRDLKD
ncbi:hypothetical protein PVAP13_8NG034601 [Panicum virgatum]|uniref:Reverse transcriptase domain-containing protein n=1 Tax=Panicum virgatum TaxID=38727 RepID=A0A8T0P548_PANVG|nr:hypothetical protein PVAP13_8NG034601 [Panicum virgatum]